MGRSSACHGGVHVTPLWLYMYPTEHRVPEATSISPASDESGPPASIVKRKQWPSRRDHDQDASEFRGLGDSDSFCSVKSRTDHSRFFKVFGEWSGDVLHRVAIHRGAVQ